MTMNPLELIEELLHRRYFGKYRGKVVDNNDLMRLGRIKVSVEGVIDDGGLWAWPCVPYAGPGVGFYCLPPSDALVWVEFEGGDPSLPIWTGCLWGMGELPTEVLTSDTRVLRTEMAQIAINDLVGEVTIKNDLLASVTLALDVKTEAGGVSSHTVGALGVISESVPGKLSVGVTGVNVNDGAFTVI
jgi:hypothetical protein